MSEIKKRKKEKELDLFYPIIGVICVVIFCVWANIYSTNYLTTNNAVVEGKLISITSRVSGPVVHLNVQEDQEVKKGDVLIEIDTSDYENRLKILQYNLKQAKTKLYEIEMTKKNEVQQSPQMFNMNKSLHRYGFSQNDFGKYAPGLIPEPEPDKTILTRDSDLKIAKEKEKAEAERLKKEKKNLPEIKNMNPIPGEEEKPEEEEIDPHQLEEDIKKFESQIEQMKLDMSYSKIYAPQDGVVSVINTAEGGYAEAGEILLSIIPKHVWVTAFYPADAIDSFAIGQPAIVRIKEYPSRKFKGIVDDILTHGEYKFDSYQSNETCKKIPIRIMFIEDYSEFDITPGTSAEVSIDIK